MPKAKEKPVETPSEEFVPELDPEAREAQMINLAVRQAEKQLREGTAPAQIVTHYLKLATVRERKELEILEQQAKLIAAKTEALESAKRIEELYSQAIDAMKLYNGQGIDEDDEDIY